ncbi:MAG TPA: hypothetical protein VFE54_12310 [Mucilaginibacter sp.]|nr:hypothetical protein [Mucilaginibacter sp.]
MKRILLYAALLGCIICGCKTSKKTSQAGVYKLEKQMVSGGGKDTVYTRTQIKIYTDDHFIYAGMAPDSSVGFGVGTYKADTGTKIIESNIYSSASLDSPKNFNVLVKGTEKGYDQVIPDLTVLKGVKYKLIEQYTKLPASDTSKLDGVWKLDAAYTVKGKDTVKDKETQYKAFWGGHFMFVHRYALDAAATKYKNGFGYGDFSLKSDTLSESEQLTSHATLMGRSYSIKINFNGNDEYSQVITDPKTKEQSVEIYRRLK